PAASTAIASWPSAASPPNSPPPFACPGTAARPSPPGRPGRVASTRSAAPPSANSAVVGPPTISSRASHGPMGRTTNRGGETMLQDSRAFSGIGVDDLEAARRFYGETLEQRVEVLDEQNGLMTLHLAGDRPTLIYQSPGVTPASYTVLNFPVDDVDAAVAWLAGRGVEFEFYDGM